MADMMFTRAALSPSFRLRFDSDAYANLHRVHVTNEVKDNKSKGFKLFDKCFYSFEQAKCWGVWLTIKLLINIQKSAWLEACSSALIGASSLLLVRNLNFCFGNPARTQPGENTAAQYYQGPRIWLQIKVVFGYLKRVTLAKFLVCWGVCLSLVLIFEGSSCWKQIAAEIYLDHKYSVNICLEFQHCWTSVATNVNQQFISW